MPYVKGKPMAGNPLDMPAMGATASIAARSPSRSTIPGGLMISAIMGEPFAATLASVALAALPSGATRGVTLHWGDGSHSAGTLTPNGAAFDIAGSHLYHAHGKFHVLIDVWQKSHGRSTILTRLKATASVAVS
jgi:hypothetical protein